MTSNKKALTMDQREQVFDEDVIGTKEAAEILHVEQQHVELLVRRKVIRAKKIGGYYALFKPSVEQYARERPRRGPKTAS